MKEARAHSEALLQEARAGLKAEVAQNKLDLQAACRPLGAEIAQTIRGKARRGWHGGGLS